MGHFRLGAAAAEADQHAAFAVRAATEVDIGDRRAIGGRRQSLGRIDRGGGGDRLVGGAVVDRQHQTVAIDAGAVARRAHQLDHHAGAAAGGHCRDAGGRTLADIHVPTGGVGGIGKVDRDARRIVGGEYLRLRYRAVAEVQVQLDAAAGQGVVADVLQRGGGRDGGAGPGGTDDQQAHQEVTARMAHDSAPHGLELVGHCICPCVPIARRVRRWRDVPSSHHCRWIPTRPDRHGLR